MERVGPNIRIRENTARNGPAIGIPFGQRGLFIASLNAANVPGNQIVAVGDFDRVEDLTSNPVGVFTTEADADTFLAAKGAGFSKHQQGISVDGFGWVVTQD